MRTVLGREVIQYVHANDLLVIGHLVVDALYLGLLFAPIAVAVGGDYHKGRIDVFQILPP